MDPLLPSARARPSRVRVPRGPCRREGGEGGSGTCGRSGPRREGTVRPHSVLAARIRGNVEPWVRRRGRGRTCSLRICVPLRRFDYHDGSLAVRRPSIESSSSFRDYPGFGCWRIPMRVFRTEDVFPLSLEETWGLL